MTSAQVTTALGLLLLLLLVGPSVTSSPPTGDDPFDFYKARSRSTHPGPVAGADGFEVPPVSAWRWYEGEPDCRPSPIGETVDRVVRDITRKNPSMARVSDARLITTTRNAFGPTLMDAKAIFLAAGRLVEAADVEVDFMSFAMEPDAEPYVAVVRGFERRLESGRPFSRPFRLRIYADHLSVLFAGGTARPKARSLLEPWLAVFRKYRLDPRLFQIEVYAHAHGAMFYHRGGRYAVHDKLLIVDGSYVHIGGANPQAKNNFDHPERDTAVVVKGEIAAAAMQAFDALWARSDFSCTIVQPGGDYRLSCTDRRTPFVVEHDPSIAAPRPDRIGLSDRACLPMTILSKGKMGYVNLEGYANPWAKGLLAAVSAATHRIALTSPNMNAPPLHAALVEAVQARNVRVNLLLPHERNEGQVNSLGGLGSNSHSLNVLRACGVRARAHSAAEFDRFRRNVRVAWWVAEGASRKFSGDGPGCFHTKFASFDDRALVVGSGNLDDQSFYHSTETSILIDSDVVARAVEGYVFTPEWHRADPFDLWAPRKGDSLGARDFPLEVMDPKAFGLCAGLRYSLK